LNKKIVLIFLSLIAVSVYLLFVTTSLSFNSALRSSGLLSHGKEIHRAIDLNEEEFVIYKTQRRSDNIPVLAHLHKNSIGFWSVEIIEEFSDEIKLASTGWVDGVVSSRFNDVFVSGFVWHRVYYGNTAIRKFSDDLPILMPPGVGIKITQNNNEFIIHVTVAGDPYPLNDLILNLLRENHFIEK